MAWAQFVQMGMQASAANFDANAAEKDAQASKTQGYLTADANESRTRARNAQMLGEQRAQAVETGFDANTGSIATIQSQSAGNLELDALTERYAGQINAWLQDETINRGKEKSDYITNPVGPKWFKSLNVPGSYAGRNGFGAAVAGIGASAYAANRTPSTLNSGNSYRGTGFGWFKRYANNDLSGTNRGSGD